MGGFIDKIKNWWLESSSTQRYTTLGGIALTFVLMFGIFTVASRPKFEMLYGGLSQVDQAAIVTDIQTQGIPVKYDTPGQVEVPSDKVAQLRMHLTTAGKVPKGAHLGDEGLTDMGLGVTPTVERERIRTMKEGEMARSIETNPGVRSARVHVTLGDPSPFSENQRPATASVSLVTAGQGSISHEAARGIAMLVANSVDGLDMKHVVVLDERSEALYNGSEATENGSIASSKLDMEQAESRKEEQRIQSTLDGVYGPLTTKVMVSCDINMDETHKHEVTQQTKKGAVVKSMTEQMAGSGPGGGQSSGIGSNLKAPATSSEKPGDNYTNTVVENEPTRTETTTDTRPAVGTVKSKTITVMADTKEGRFDTPEKLAALTSIIKNQVAGKDPSKFKAEVVPTNFDDTSKVQIVKAQDESKSAARMQQLFSLLPIVALLIVGIMVVKQLGKISKPTLATMMTVDGQMMQVPMGGGQVQTTYMTTGNSDHASAQGVESYNKALSKYSEAELAQMSEDGIIYRDNDEIVEVEKIREKKSVHLSAIKQMAKDRPEPTAM